jgi:hypothetical protein
LSYHVRTCIVQSRSRFLLISCSNSLCTYLLVFHLFSYLFLDIWTRTEYIDDDGFQGLVSGITKNGLTWLGSR